MIRAAVFDRFVPTSVSIKRKGPVENPQKPLSFLVPRQGLEPRTY